MKANEAAHARKKVRPGSSRKRKKVTQETRKPRSSQGTIDDIPNVQVEGEAAHYDGVLFRVDKAATLKKIFEVLGGLLEEIIVLFTPDGVQVFSLDPGNIACIDLRLESERFDEYLCSSNLSIGINVQSVVKLFSCIKLTDTVTWVLGGDDPVKAEISVERPGVTQTFELRLIEINQEPLEAPATPYTASVRISSKELQTQAKLCTNLGGSNIEFCITRSKFTLRMKESDSLVENSKAEYTYIEEYPDQVLIDCEEDTSDVFAASYIEKFAKAASLSDWVTIHMNQDFPVKITFAAGELGELTFYLAPKITDN